MHAVLSGRVLLHLREVAVNRTQTGSAFDTQTGAFSEPAFLKPRPNLASALQTTTWFGDDDESRHQISSRAPQSTTILIDDGGWTSKS